MINFISYERELNLVYSDEKSTICQCSSLSSLPSRTERSVYGSKRIKYGIFTALRRISFTKIHLRYIYISITGGFWSSY
jgi:hypothetical protein